MLPGRRVISTQTVSRVINDRPDVSPETRERIQQVIEELDYQPSALARSLISQRSFTLGVVTAGLKYIGPSRTLNGITSMAEELKYALLLEELPHFDTEDIKPLLQDLLARHVDGIVWAVPEVGDNRRWVDEILHGCACPGGFFNHAASSGNNHRYRSIIMPVVSWQPSIYWIKAAGRSAISPGLWIGGKPASVSRPGRIL